MKPIPHSPTRVGGPIPDASFRIFNIGASGTGKDWLRISNLEDESKPAEILIYDQIGKDWFSEDGINAKMFADELKKIPLNRDILLRVHSPGGNVFDSIAIYNMLDARRDRVTAQIDGVAFSCASWIILAAKEVRMPKTARMMIHDASGFSVGNAEEMRKLADLLDRESNNIADIYAKKTGKSSADMRALMKAETWMNGDEAKKRGFVDVVTDGAVMNCQFENLPFNIRSNTEIIVDKETGQDDKQSLAKNGTKIMDRAKLLKTLRNFGVTISDDATDDQIFAALAGLKIATESNPGNALPNKSDETIAALQLAVTALTNQASEKRKGEVAIAVQSAIDNDQIPANQKDSWVKMAMDDTTGTVLTNLAALPSKPPGAPPIDIEVTDVAPKDIGAGLAKFNEPTKSWQRGNSVPMRVIRDAAVNRGLFINKHRNNLISVWNTNTIATELKRSVILQEVITDFARIILPLRAFSTVFENVPLEGTNKVQVPFYDLDATASTSWVAGTGYVAGNTTTDKREITVGTGATDGDRIYQGLSFTSEEIARQPYLNIVQFARLKVEKLAYDMFTDVLGVVTLANYGAAGLTVPASAFDSEDMADLKLACKLWPETGRSVIIDSAYDANLLKDPSVKSKMDSGMDALITGMVPKIMGFDYYTIPTIPSNAENLTGFAVFQSAILVATAPVPPVEEVRNAGTNYQVIVDPGTGIALEYRSFGDNTLDTGKHFVEVSYGFAKGNGNALKRIVSA